MQTTPAEVRHHAIQVADLKDALRFCKVRQRTNGRTAAFCALSIGYTAFEVDCHSGRAPRPDDLEHARNHLRRARVSPIERGSIASLIERVQLVRGRKEVLRTWGIGVRALLAEGSRYVLRGGAQ